MSKKDLLIELADCWRGDWSEFDGRTLQRQIGDWLNMDDSPEAITKYREDWFMCPKGEGHWQDFCEGYGHHSQATAAPETTKQ